MLLAALVHMWRVPLHSMRAAGIMHGAWCHLLHVQTQQSKTPTRPWRTGYVSVQVAALLRASSPTQHSRSKPFSPDRAPLPSFGSNSFVASTVGIVYVGCERTR